MNGVNMHVLYDLWTGIDEFCMIMKYDWMGGCILA